jgi:hypothetical protein
MGIFREIILGMLDAIKGFFSFIPGLGKKEASASSRQPTRLSSSHSRSALQGISQPVPGQGDEPLPINQTEFQTIFKSIRDLQPKLKNILQAFSATIPEEAYSIAEKMTNVSASLANKMGLDPNLLSEIHKKLKDRVGLFKLKDNLGDLIKIVQFYGAQFGMSKEAMALA